MTNPESGYHDMPRPLAILAAVVGLTPVVLGALRAFGWF